jgi:hypothetical protein
MRMLLEVDLQSDPFQDSRELPRVLRTLAFQIECRLEEGPLEVTDVFAMKDRNHKPIGEARFESSTRRGGTTVIRRFPSRSSNQLSIERRSS